LEAGLTVAVDMESLEKNLSILEWFPDVDRDLLLLAISTSRRSYLSTGAERRLREKYAAERFDYETLEFFGDKVLGMLAVSRMIKTFDLGRSIKDYAYYFKEFVRNRNLTRISLNLGLCEDIFPDEDITVKHNACADAIESILGALFVQYQSIEKIEEWFFSLSGVKDNIDNIFEIEYPASEDSGASDLEESSREEIVPEEIPEEIIAPVVEIKQKKVKKVVVDFIPIPTNNSDENIKLFEELVDHDIRKWKIKIPEALIRVSQSFFLTPEEIFPILSSHEDDVKVTPFDLPYHECDTEEQIRYLNSYDQSPSERLRGVGNQGELYLYSKFYKVSLYGYYSSSERVESQTAIAFGREEFEKYKDFYSLFCANNVFFNGKVDFFKKFDIFPSKIPRPIDFKYNFVARAVNLIGEGKYLPSSIQYDTNLKTFSQILGKTEKIVEITGQINEERPIFLHDAIACVDRIFQELKRDKITFFYDVPKYYQKSLGVKGKAYGIRMITDGRVEEILLSFVSNPTYSDYVAFKGVLAFQCLRMLTLVTNLTFPKIDDVEIPLDPKFYLTERSEALSAKIRQGFRS
jgi:hypothetical protein